MAEEEHAHDEEAGHEHGTITFQRTEIDEVALGSLRPLHPALADALLLARRFGSLNDEDKRLLEEAQTKVVAFDAWTPGFHAPGDRCRACQTPVEALFVDRFEQGAIPYAAMVDDLPVHPTAACLAGAKPARSPQERDRLRRELTLDRARPSAKLVQFFRADLLTRPPFGLEDWANSVAEANAASMDKGTARDIERLLTYVHKRLFH